MADFLYKNEYTKQKPITAADYEVVGQKLMEVWTKQIEFKSGYERHEYFSNPHIEHCLSVELDLHQKGYEGIPMVVFFIDDKQIDYISKTIPTDTELIAMLKKYG
jgi:hypothetical protein